MDLPARLRAYVARATTQADYDARLIVQAWTVRHLANSPTLPATDAAAVVAWWTTTNPDTRYRDTPDQLHGPVADLLALLADLGDLARDAGHALGDPHRTWWPVNVTSSGVTLHSPAGGPPGRSHGPTGTVVSLDWVCAWYAASQPLTA